LGVFSPKPATWIGRGPIAIRAAAFLLTAGTLALVQSVVKPPMLLFERFVPGAGWAQALLLAGYAAWLCGFLLEPRRQPRARRWLWLGFSLLFFGQLGLGLLGLPSLLMTGELHLPVPALIAAGPLSRGERFFMPVLFGATLLLVGPAWCSHLCYIGAWDHEASRRRRQPAALPRWSRSVRAGILVGVLGLALVFRWLGVPGTVAAACAAAFGLVGLGIMLFWSRRAGVMAHCVVFCPMGLLANLLGKLSPFRLRLESRCDGCGGCSRACRYDALGPEAIARRRPALSCTLCGDCVRSCHSGAIGFAFLGLSPTRARALFVVLVTSLHAVFLGCARL
jgi:polyferredoxin